MGKDLYDMSSMINENINFPFLSPVVVLRIPLLDFAV
jgi:hypothetical protein